MFYHCYVYSLFCGLLIVLFSFPASPLSRQAIDRYVPVLELERRETFEIDSMERGGGECPGDDSGRDGSSARGDGNISRLPCKNTTDGRLPPPALGRERTREVTEEGEEAVNAA